ncbi:hypothetical protein [Citrobacter freundii]|uniref:hypothetical protein n=1 Tax=Citrobacter freundii TaxID=546 RepID=UPI0040427E4D
MIVLKYPPYPSPFWFRGEKDKTGVVTEVGTVYVEATKDNLLLVECSGQLKLATALEFFQYRFSDSFGGNPPL